MRRTLLLSNRILKEMLRDPLTLIFGLGFPVVLLVFFNIMQANLPFELFEIDRITPGISFFGLSFISLFSATLISRDRDSAFFARLCTTPLSTWNFILGYTLPFLLISIPQCLLCYLASVLMGLPITAGIGLAILLGLPSALFYTALGLLLGCLLSERQAGPICGAAITNLTVFLAGIWFDLSLLGEGFQRVANLLPFSHANQLAIHAYQCDLAGALPHLIWVSAYAVVLTLTTVFVFSGKIRR